MLLEPLFFDYLVNSLAVQVKGGAHLGHTTHRPILFRFWAAANNEYSVTGGYALARLIAAAFLPLLLRSFSGLAGRIAQ